MADANRLNSSQVVSVVGAGSTGVEQTPVQSTAQGGLHTNLRDNAGAEAGVLANPVQATDGIASGGVQGAIVVGTAAVEVKVNGTALANRRVVTLYNNSVRIWFWGYTSAVTIATGTPIDPDDLMVWDLAKGSTASIWVIAAFASLDGRVTEAA
jgi:hypothetical protein